MAALKPTVAEKCMKLLPVSFHLLGFHLSASVKDKIWRGEFIDILFLLLTSKEPKSNKKSEDRYEEDRRIQKDSHS